MFLEPSWPHADVYPAGGARGAGGLPGELLRILPAASREAVVGRAAKSQHSPSVKSRAPGTVRRERQRGDRTHLPQPSFLGRQLLRTNWLHYH